jgi:hypothetical protein
MYSLRRRGSVAEDDEKRLSGNDEDSDWVTLADSHNAFDLKMIGAPQLFRKLE